MAKILLRTTEIWRVDTEEEAAEIIQNASEQGGDLTKKTVEVKQKKSKGQVIAENLRVTTQVDFADQWCMEAGGGDE